MGEYVIELQDRVMIRGRESEGEYVVTQTRGTVGVLTDNDLLQLNKPGEGLAMGWVKRGELILLMKATPQQKKQFGW